MAGHGMSRPSKNWEWKLMSGPPADALHTQLDPHHPGRRQEAKFMSTWPAEIHLPGMLPQRLFGPIIWGLRLKQCRHGHVRYSV